jgi:hypothetical protein
MFVDIFDLMATNLIINEAELDFKALVILFYHHTKHISLILVISYTVFN